MTFYFTRCKEKFIDERTKYLNIQTKFGIHLEELREIL
jgi:hypothetical protein